MAAEWPSRRVGDLARIKHGFAFKGEHFTDTPTDYCAITPGNVRIGGGFDRQSTKYYNGPVPDDYVLSPGSLVVTMTDLSKQSDTLGYGALVPQDLPYTLLHNQRIGLVELESSAACDLHFLHWVFRSPGYRQEILASASGTTVKHTAPSRIGAYTFRLPPINEQRSIARVLGALDDKIDLNRKMNETLEQIVQAIFKSWFIDFDGQTEFQDSPMGPIPKGWSSVPLPELIEINPRLSLAKEELAPYVDMKALSTSGSTIAELGERAYSGGSKFANGDTLFARITPCLENGKTALVDCLPEGRVGAGSTEFIVMRGNGAVPPHFVYCLARSETFRTFALAQMTGTSGRQRVPNDCFWHLELAKPPERLLLTFGELAKPLFERIRHNADESQTLSELRDTLLPKLISGEIRIRDAEKTVGEAT